MQGSYNYFWSKELNRDSKSSWTEFEVDRISCVAFLENAFYVSLWIPTSVAIFNLFSPLNFYFPATCERIEQDIYKAREKEACMSMVLTISYCIYLLNIPDNFAFARVKKPVVLFSGVFWDVRCFVGRRENSWGVCWQSTGGLHSILLLCGMIEYLSGSNGLLYSICRLYYAMIVRKEDLLLSIGFTTSAPIVVHLIPGFCDSNPSQVWNSLKHGWIVLWDLDYSTMHESVTCFNR